MSRGDLQEMEQSKTAVNANAKPAEGMPKLSNPGEGLSTSYEDLGGPTPENYSPTNDSAKLKEPKIATVKDVVNSKAVKADAMKSMTKEEIESGEEVLEEDQVSTDEVVAEVEEYDIDEDVNALLGGEELSEEFREKAKTIFEAALTSKVKEIQETLETQYAEALAEEAQAQKAELQERVDSYLEYVAQEWMSENQLAIEHGLKTEMTESFLGGMKSLFEEHYVTIPEDKYDVLESMVEKLDDMETKLNEQIEKNISLNGRLAESVADGILDSVSEGLASTQKEKLASLAESVEFESEEEYREKLETLKESYFSRTATAKSEAPQTISEGVDSTPAPIGSSMDAYLRTLGAFKK
jgi:outer membrane protein OmpA-like peptidoglycan-associated protein